MHHASNTILVKTSVSLISNKCKYPLQKANTHTFHLCCCRWHSRYYFSALALFHSNCFFSAVRPLYILIDSPCYLMFSSNLRPPRHIFDPKRPQWVNKLWTKMTQKQNATEMNFAVVCAKNGPFATSMSSLIKIENFRKFPQTMSANRFNNDWNEMPFL